jgi:transposase
MHHELYRARNVIERYFNKIKRCRRIATRYDEFFLPGDMLERMKIAGYGRATGQIG